MKNTNCRFREETGCDEKDDNDDYVYLPDLKVKLKIRRLWKHYMVEHLVQPTEEETRVVMAADPKKASARMPAKRVREVKIMQVERGYDHPIGTKPDTEFIQKLKSISFCLRVYTKGWANCRFREETGCRERGSTHKHIRLHDSNVLLYLPCMWEHYATKHLVQPTEEERRLVMATDSDNISCPSADEYPYEELKSGKLRLVKMLCVERTCNHPIGTKPDEKFIKKLEAIVVNAGLGLPEAIGTSIDWRGKQAIVGVAYMRPSTPLRPQPIIIDVPREKYMLTETHRVFLKIDFAGAYPKPIRTKQRMEKLLDAIGKIFQSALELASVNNRLLIRRAHIRFERLDDGTIRFLGHTQRGSLRIIIDPYRIFSPNLRPERTQPAPVIDESIVRKDAWMLIIHEHGHAVTIPNESRKWEAFMRAKAEQIHTQFKYLPTRLCTEALPRQFKLLVAEFAAEALLMLTNCDTEWLVQCCLNDSLGRWNRPCTASEGSIRNIICEDFKYIIPFTFIARGDYDASDYGRKLVLERLTGCLAEFPPAIKQDIINLCADLQEVGPLAEDLFNFDVLKPSLSEMFVRFCEFFNQHNKKMARLILLRHAKAGMPINAALVPPFGNGKKTNAVRDIMAMELESLKTERFIDEKDRKIYLTSVGREELRQAEQNTKIKYPMIRDR